MSEEMLMALLPYFLFPIIAIIGMFAITTLTKEKDLFRVSWDKLAQFVAFLTVVFVMRVLIESFKFDVGLVHGFPRLPPEIGNHKWTFGLVFWEDFFFAVPIYFIMKHCQRKWLRVLSIVTLSILFGLGHAYQGLSGIVITAFLPYFVSYNFGKKYGFGTSMLGHILYDVSTAYMVILLPLLI